MNLTKLKQQREELDKKIKKLEKLEKQKSLNINTKDLIKIPELNIEVTKPVEWTKPYNEIIAPKGFRKIKLWELWFILDGSKYMDEFLGSLKGEYNWFWCEQTDYAKKNNYSSGLCLDRDLDVYSGDEDLAYSYVYGRVVFCRRLK